jgi:hypothetical protein
MSIPTSLIVVVLVLAWLVVLVPMVARRREAVPEAEMSGGTFRVLQRSGDGVRRRSGFRRQSGSAAGDRVDADQPVHGDAEPDEHELDEELLDDEYTDGYAGDDFGTDGYDEEYDNSEGGRSDVPVAQAEPVAVTPARLGRRQSAGSHPYRPERAASGSHPYRPAARGPLPVEVEYHQVPTVEEPESVWRERDSASYEEDFVDDHSSSMSSDSVSQQHADDMHLRPIPRRAGRGGYDPDAAEVARQFKYSRRRRVTVVLLLATLLFSAAALVISPVLWVGTVVFALLLIGFLAYLRRQVQIEANIRERRLARLRRARQIRPEYDFEHAESFATSGAMPRGAVPASQVPTGLRRGRQIVDLDDDDPAFEDLEYYQPVAYRRASGH